MDAKRFDWNLIKSFLAVLDAGTLSGAAETTGISQPTLGRHIDEMETRTGLVLFERGRAGMTPTPNALALAEEARVMQAGAAAFAMAAAGRETAVEGVIRITASEIMSNYVLPAILIELQEAEPALEIELVATNSVENLLARDADIAVRMVRPTQNDLIARKVNDFAMGAYARGDYLARYGTPQTVEDLAAHRLIGYDRSDLIERGMMRLGIRFDRSLFRFRTDHQVVYWELVKAGAGIGFGPRFVAAQSPGLVRVFADFDIEPLPVWLTSHRELKHSAKVRRVYDFLAERLSALRLGEITPEANAGTGKEGPSPAR
ncbi:LysR family transcriptional regulator [Oricola cellulosilytica]|uniref:LysR family transcriptional regulator n=1 Tax=Oricola cellulosilytica TaxID=1429082 RepID=A0A4R0PEP2_9HYPH|nr:LysR family transcriptional regulator [Oricola cellulosilytica]TCD13843.1 LysR family transcriptional regulator [Oricola cellulosilytica]